MSSVYYFACTGEQFFEALGRVGATPSARVAEPALESQQHLLPAMETDMAEPASVVAGRQVTDRLPAVDHACL